MPCQVTDLALIRPTLVVGWGWLLGLKSVDWACWRFLDSILLDYWLAIVRTSADSKLPHILFMQLLFETVYSCLCGSLCDNAFFLFHSEDLPDEVRERWETFCTSSLGETNKRNTVDLVGFTRLHLWGFWFSQPLPIYLEKCSRPSVRPSECAPQISL